jgi:hypothetical protein
MAVNFEIKGMLAKCLAMENIIIEHKKVETACFNVHTRVLTLPMWEKASNNIYTMLVLHEISHALWTPNYDWAKECKVPPQFVNICEDVRVEKLCKRKYPGSPKSFYNGYKELNEEDFFEIGDDNLETYNLADRVNLWFKVGNFTNIFIKSGEETDIKTMIADAETFDDVLIAAEELYKYCKKEKEEEKGEESNTESNDADSEESDGNQQPDSNSGEEEGQSDDNDFQQQQQQQQSQSIKQNWGGEKNKELEVKTVDSLEKALKDLVSNDGYENVYLELPHLDLKKIIVSNQEIHTACKKTWDDYAERVENTHESVFGEVDKNFVEFKRSAQKEVNYLVKEFECRKAADSYARATTARTGVLDCTKLHTYKYNEDLFRKVTTLAEGKNHGLVFVLDWSGSMANVMTDTIKQLFNLVWFCKKTNIPFEVYAFTNDYPLVSYDEDGKANIRQLSYAKKDGLVQVGEWFSMMNLLTSKSNGKTLDDQMKNVFRIVETFSSYRRPYGVPMGMNLSGTPLNEALVSLHQILPKFQKENKLQKVQCVILTDGEAPVLKCHREVYRHWEKDSYVGTSYIGPNSFIRNRKTGNTYSCNVEWYGFTDILLRNLRDSFTDINFIGIRVLDGRDANSFIRRYCGYYGNEYNKVMSTWKKEKAFTIKESGYHSYFGLSSNTLSQDSGFDVAEDASKAQIKTAFVKSLRIKKMNKKVLGEFISLVA